MKYAHEQLFFCLKCNHNLNHLYFLLIKEPFINLNTLLLVLERLRYLEGRPLISEAVEDASAAAQEVIHASVCVVQVGVKL